VSYEGLEIGEYVFQVKAIDRDLNYSDAAQVKLNVIPDPRNHKIAQLEEQIRERERAEMERMHGELEDARQIQRSLLPEKTPILEGFEIAATSLPAREVSGDFYDYLWLEKDLGIVLADVSGKSVRAAMVAAMANGMLHVGISGRRDIWNSPGEILKELNVALQPRLIREMFTSMSLSILQAAERRLIFSNAGMPYPIIKRGEKVWELKVNGLPLGIVGFAEYSELGIDLESEDLVVFCSDGIIEAANEEGEMYETDRLLEVMQRADPGISAQEMMDWILKDVTAFAGGDEPSDDITIIVLRCNEGNEPGSGE
jgi:sigma-B regulation protein RsbU (phosphoserine phosphatase)